MKLPPATTVGDFAEVEGVKVFYRSSGTGAPILLLHGFPTSSYDWRALMDPLSKFGRVLAPDLYGFGYSGFSEQVGLPQFLPEFLDAMSLDRVTLVGYDYGGSLCLSYAVENPSQVSRLIVMNTTAYPDWIDHARKSPSYALIRRMMKNPIYRRMALLLLNQRDIQRFLAPKSEAPIPREELAHQLLFIKRGMRTLTRMRPRPYTEAFFQELELSGRRTAEGIRKLRLPTLIIFGEDDPYFPSGTAERLHRDLRGSRLHILERTGHMLMEERPERVAELITTFLKETPS